MMYGVKGTMYILVMDTLGNQNQNVFMYGEKQ